MYATLLALGVMARMHWVLLPGGLDLVASWWVIGASALLYSAEFFADKIPGLDLVWNAAHTFVRVPVAALLAFSASSHLSPELQVLATVAGAAIASLAHGSKLAARVLVTPSPEPVSNIVLSGAEDVGAVGLVWFATHHPYVGAGIVAVLLGLTITVFRLVLRAIATSYGRLQQQARAGFNRLVS